LLPAALATIYVVWGSTYLAIRVMVETMPPLLAAGVRFATAGAIFLGLLRLRSGPARVRATRAELAGAALIGNLLCFGGNGLVTVAERDVPSGLAALIIGSVPLWVVVMRSIHGDRVPRAARWRACWWASRGWRCWCCPAIAPAARRSAGCS